MAPPNPELPLQERLIALAKTLQFGWFVGHVLLILSTFRYSLSWLRFNYYGTMAVFSYRFAFLAAATTYGIVVYKTFRARAKAGAKNPGLIGLAADENVQYLGMAILWLFSPQYPLALLPYCVYSIFHTLTYSRANLIPVLQPPKPVSSSTSPGGSKTQYAPNPIADKIGVFVRTYYDDSMAVVSSLEILLWLRILLSAIFFQRRSWILIVVYTAFLRSRFAQSTHVQHSFRHLESRIDGLIGSQGTPPAARQVWEQVKGGVRQFYTATDVSKYLNGGAAAPKKAS
ncbi:related to uncharacterized integral membrane protein [Cephalotrichum gorgonifer]|uniref:Related to uncharacterized integral membrane protein n=1 Tax=Cephalotrichum gorgonifer TaxID=2041049 RepID=A0AAE8MR76_9PEZI|nr:related to uncharacterized integral membrane protein [Cephalotrichum gorgonifer]